MRDEVLGEGVEQFGMHRRIGAAEVVGRIGEPFAKKLSPDPVRRRAGEVRVIRTRHPGGERLSGVFGFLDLDDRAAEQLRHGGFLEAEMLDRAFRVDVNRVAVHHPAGHRRSAFDLGEERREAEVIVLRPDIERVIMTLRQRNRKARKRCAVCSAAAFGSTPSRA